MDRTPLGALVEQTLLASKQAVWLERTEIDKLIHEQQLQLLLGPEAVKERSGLGRLLKADLLVILRHVAKPVEHEEMVVCETASGLRLGVHSVPASSNAEADAKQLAALAEQSMAKQREQIRDICAVPPFLSQDLTFEDDYLKAAYAKMVEEIIRQWPGLLSVELEEARAIAREAALSESGIRRMVPLYLLGEYRHEGRGDAQSRNPRTGNARREGVGGPQSRGIIARGGDPVRASSCGRIARQGGRSSGPCTDAALEARQLAHTRKTFTGLRAERKRWHWQRQAC